MITELRFDSHLLQDALIEELLQLLVTVVDTELLKAVVFKVLCRTKTRKQLRVLRHNQRESDKLRSLDVEITTMSRDE